MSDKAKLTLLALLALGLIALYLLVDLHGNWGYVLPRRAKKLLAMVLTGTAIAFCTVVFQTVTNNRILTPSMIGLDSLYMLLQTGVVFAFGSQTLILMNKQVHFGLTVGLMALFGIVLYRLFFRGGGRNNLYFLLLVGVICGTFFGSITSFMQMLIDPNEFSIVQDRMFASFNNVNTAILQPASVVLAAASIYIFTFTRFLDVMALGREHALNLGVGYDGIVKKMLMAITVLISVSTALVGPVTFLGLIVVHIAYRMIRTYRHTFVMPAAALVSVIALVGGQLVVERIFTFTTTLSVIINFIGGLYFLFLLVKENRSW